jgi:murein DD-endopeptidase MepM/ murein hydrolase activator NlpD
VTLVDGLPDHMPGVANDPSDPAGNHVVIKVADREYVLIAHMQAGSLTVSEGDTVEQGQEIGLVGNSGNTSEPHIHIHVQDKPTFDPSATGLLLKFSSYLANGLVVESGELKADLFVVNE